MAELVLIRHTHAGRSNAAEDSERPYIDCGQCIAGPIDQRIRAFGGNQEQRRSDPDERETGESLPFPRVHPVTQHEKTAEERSVRQAFRGNLEPTGNGYPCYRPATTPSRIQCAKIGRAHV